MSKSPDPKLQEPTFAEDPRPETKPKDPDPIPSDRWLALIRAGLAVAFLTQSVQARGVGPYTVFEGILTLLIIAISYAAAMGYRSGFGLFALFGVFQVYSVGYHLSRGMLVTDGWLVAAANVYAALFALYAAARYFRWWPRPCDHATR